MKNIVLIVWILLFFGIQHGVYDGQYYYRLDAKNGINGMDGKGYFNLINNYNDFRTDYNYVAVGKNILKQTPKGIESVWHILRLDGKTLWIKQDFII